MITSLQISILLFTSVVIGLTAVWNEMRKREARFSVKSQIDISLTNAIKAVKMNLLVKKINWYVKALIRVVSVFNQNVPYFFYICFQFNSLTRPCGVSLCCASSSSKNPPIGTRIVVATHIIHSMLLKGILSSKLKLQ